ncbi:MAG TPA: nucleoside triphosphate pyrophosphohydrolase family protein [Acidimicrobiales bacterium]|nr:nucleoside triphosphate pyrophosphohydrolase family protein [Acidimicrobiales bacterium]
MDLDTFQRRARVTAMYPDAGANLVYPVLGLASEAGEVAGKAKKAIRDAGGVIDPARRSQILDELGDVLWYVAAICDELHASMEEVAASTLVKLASRAERGALQGSGDDR